MQALDFLRLVRPDGLGAYVTKGDVGFKHFLRDTNEALASRIEEAITRGENGYYTMASFKQGWHEHKGKKRFRTQENVDKLKAFWLDIDYKLGTGEKSEAIKAVKDWCAAYGIPDPNLVVETGGGLHVYWVLDVELGAADWRVLAGKIKALTIAGRLAADHAVTSDPARILRFPGSVNTKYDPPASAKVLTEGPAISLEAFRAALGAAQPGSEVNVGLTGGLGTRHEVSRDASYKLISRHCAQSRDALDTGGADHPEPLWMAHLQLLKFCKNGLKYAYLVSNGHEDYDPDTVRDKFDQRLANDAGPTTCAKFAELRSGPCEACPYKTQIKSPIQLGRAGGTIPASTEDNSTGKPLVLPPGWRVVRDGLDSFVERRIVNDDKTVDWVRAFSGVPTALRLGRDEAGDAHLFSTFIVGKNTVKIDVPCTAFATGQKFAEAVHKKGFNLHDNEVKLLRTFMTTWLQKIMQDEEMYQIVEHLGWLDNDGGFVTGNRVIPVKGAEQTDIKPAQKHLALANAFGGEGELDKWKEVAAFITEQNFLPFVTVLAASFGAPLLKFTGLSGGCLSVVSTASGVGKSSALMTAQGVWGHPTDGLQYMDDTKNFVATKLGYIRHLPVFWDELRGQKAENNIYDLVFSMYAGKDKSRLNRASEAMQGQKWETLAVCASNFSILDIMHKRDPNSDAGGVRVFELTIDDPPAHDHQLDQTTKLFSSVKTNYGLAGDVYARYVVRHIPDVRELVGSVFERYAQSAGTQAERFWVGTATAIYSGAVLANKANLCSFKLDDLDRFLIAQFEVLRERTSLAKGEKRDIVRMQQVYNEYLKRFSDERLVISKVPPKRRPRKGEISIAEHPPRKKATYVYAEEDGATIISATHFTKYCADHGYAEYGLYRKIEASLNATSMKSILGAGTHYAVGNREVVFIVPDDTTQDADESPAESSGSSSD